MLNQLRNLLEEQGQTLVGVVLRGNLWYVYKHDPKQAGPKPVLEYCRDALDYQLLKSQWEKLGMVVLFVDEDFDKAVSGAIEAAQKAG